MVTKEKRQKLVKGALSFTEGTPIAPCAYEKHLLDEFIKGNLSIDEAISLLEAYKALNDH